MYTFTLTLTVGDGPYAVSSLSVWNTTGSVPQRMHQYEERLRRPEGAVGLDVPVVLSEMARFLARADDAWHGVSPLASRQIVDLNGRAGRGGSDPMSPEGPSSE